MRISLRHLFYLLLLGGLIFALVSACGKTVNQSVTNSKQPTHECRIVQHAMGEICIPLNPQRVITLYNTLGNTLALGIKPIGTTYTARAPLPEYLQGKMDGIELLGDTMQPNLEKILQLKPDLILSSSELQNIYGSLSSIAPTFVIDHSYDPSWKVQLKELAEVLDKEETSEQLMKEYWEKIEEIKHELRDSRNQIQVSVIRFSSGSITPYGKKAPLGIVLNDIGLKRIPAQRENVYYLNNVSIERLPDIDGDVIFIGLYRTKESDEALKELQQNPLWQKLKAVQQNRVYFVDVLQYWDNVLAVNSMIDELFKYLVDSP